MIVLSMIMFIILQFTPGGGDDTEETTQTEETVDYDF